MSFDVAMFANRSKLRSDSPVEYGEMATGESSRT